MKAIIIILFTISSHFCFGQKSDGTILINQVLDKIDSRLMDSVTVLNFNSDLPISSSINDYKLMVKNLDIFYVNQKIVFDKNTYSNDDINSKQLNINIEKKSISIQINEYYINGITGQWVTSIDNNTKEWVYLILDNGELKLIN